MVISRKGVAERCSSDGLRWLRPTSEGLEVYRNLKMLRCNARRFCGTLSLLSCKAPKKNQAFRLLVGFKVFLGMYVRSTSRHSGPVPPKDVSLK